MEFEVFNRETYKLILTTYPPPKVKNSPSVHKLLGHTWDLIALNDNHGLGTVSEGGIEACNKLLRGRVCGHSLEEMSREQIFQSSVFVPSVVCTGMYKTQ